MTDLANRAYNHTFRFDPIVRSLLDTDFYKFLMLQLIWKKYRDVRVVFKMTNRAKDVKLASIIPQREIEEQIEWAQNLKFQPNELIWLQGQTFYGVKGIFEPGFIEFLRNFKLPKVSVKIDPEDQNQYLIETDNSAGDITWAEATLWEIHILEIVNTLRNRNMTANFSRLDFDILYSGAKVKLWNKLNKLNELPNLRIADFGTRRRWDFLFQEWAVTSAKEILGEKFIGTSNVFLAMKHSLEAIGTNAHELPMVYAALANSDEELLTSQYKVLEDWKEMYQGNLLIALPDTFGSTQFFKNAPEWFWKEFKGVRWDSKDPLIAGEENISDWVAHGQDPLKKMGIASDGLDVDSIIECYNKFVGRMPVGYGWGTKFSNDFVGCHPRGRDQEIKPISLVCKVDSVKAPNDDRTRYAVKLSDNPEKAMSSSQEEIIRYKRVFGTEGFESSRVEV